MLKIAIDAGHYKGTPGRRCLAALDPSETREWELNRRVADKLEELLAQAAPAGMQDGTVRLCTGGDGAAARTGAFIYAACDRATGRVLGSEGAARTARTAVEGMKRLDYDILFNNCHLFTATCLLESTPGKWASGIFTVAGLEEVVAARLNAGRPVAWLPVRGYDADPGLLPRKLARIADRIRGRKPRLNIPPAACV